MRHLLHIFLLVLTATVGVSCQNVLPLHELDRRSDRPLFAEQQEVRVQSGNDWHGSARAQNGTRFYEGMLTESPSPCRTFCHSEERAQTRSGERTSPTSHGGGKTYTAYRIPRSSIHQVFGGFVQRTTVSIRSFASHIALFYMLRHIIR